MNFDTQAIRFPEGKSQQREHSSALYLTSSFTFESAEAGQEIFSGQREGNLYSRFSNPNTQEFIEKMCLLEKCEDGVATASGMAAVYATFMSHLKTGDHVLAARDIFGNSKYILSDILNKFNISTTWVDVDDKEGWAKQVRSNTRMIFLETPSNPTLKIADLEFLGQLSKENDMLFVVDNCMATPYLQNPSDFGADLVLHSATKYIDGQGRVLGGCILGKKKWVQPCYDFLRRTGAALSPFNAWVLTKSLETLSLRMERHSENAFKLFNFLKNRKEVKRVFYPFDQDSKQYDLAKKQMKLGGGMLGFEIHGDIDSTHQFMNELRLFSLTANLGDTRSIITHPASTTHSKLSKEELKNCGISSSYLRVSVGLEHADDLIQDITNALKKIQ